LIFIRWTREAATDLEQINEYLREHFPDLARPTISKLYASVISLKRMPHRADRGGDAVRENLSSRRFPTSLSTA
jgi:plasmid stabilization system protein ParE